PTKERPYWDLGVLDRAGVREKARMDAPVHARRGVSARGPRRGGEGIHTRGPPDAGRGQAAEAVGNSPTARAGRPGLWAGEAGPDARDRGRVGLGADRVWQPGTRLRELRDPRPLRHRGAEEAVAPSAARWKNPLRLFDDRA